MPDNDLALFALRSYLRQEPEKALCEEARSLLQACELGDKAATVEARDRFVGHLSFGTAGLRGKMEAGFRRLNQVTVAKAAFAIGKALKDKGLIVVGHDARLNSDVFADELISVLRGLGFSIYSFECPVATPICAFAVTHLKAVAGIMVTASHNPPSDNGLKVYGANGAQIVSPLDRLIEANLRDAPDYQDLPRSTVASSSDRLKSKIDEVFHAYLKAAEKTQISPSAVREKIKVVYTPLHGVGYRFIHGAIAAAHFVELLAVEKQKEPDGRFLTLPFPNPEEEGALDLAFEMALYEKADIIIANDPDADRLAVALPDATGAFKMLSGNELGAILGCDVLENMATSKKKLVVTTLVSSRLLKAMAKVANASYAESLTGFSRIAEIAFEREAKGEQFVFGFEEALGFCIGNFVRDKDGLASAVHLAERVALLKAQKLTLWDELDRIALKYGLFRNIQWSLRFSGADAGESMQALMTKIRGLHSAFVGGETIESRHDLLNEDYESFARANVLVFFLDDGTRIVVRPSGTEPKVKFYAEKSATVANKQQLETKRRELDHDLASFMKTTSAVLSRPL